MRALVGLVLPLEGLILDPPALFGRIATPIATPIPTAEALVGLLLWRLPDALLCADLGRKLRSLALLGLLGPRLTGLLLLLL